MHKTQEMVGEKIYQKQRSFHNVLPLQPKSSFYVMYPLNLLAVIKKKLL